MFLIFRTENTWPDLLEAQTVDLDARENAHARARRLSDGAIIHVGDGNGRRWSGPLSWTEKKRARVELTGNCEKPTESLPSFALLSAIPKSSRRDWLIEKCTELGLRRFIPAEFQRSVREKVSPDRFERLSREAAAQSESWYLPVLERNLDRDQIKEFLLGQLKIGVQIHILDLPESRELSLASTDPARVGSIGHEYPGGSNDLPLHSGRKSDKSRGSEPSSEGNHSLLSDASSEGNHNLLSDASSEGNHNLLSDAERKSAYSHASDGPRNRDDSRASGADRGSYRAKVQESALAPNPENSREILIVVGPEGGFSDEDRKAWHEIQQDGNCRIVPLGPQILRVETAAIAYLSYLSISRVLN
ncbi:MAG: RsmE family RNA methyltransferase [Leptospiraceae bacterium]